MVVYMVDESTWKKTTERANEIVKQNPDKKLFTIGKSKVVYSIDNDFKSIIF
jgi:hypothetical protein